MSYYVYADVERTSYDGGSIFKKFDTKEEALRCKAEIAYITSHYESLMELSRAIADGEYTIAIIDQWARNEGLSDEDNAEEWVYNTYSSLVTYHEEYLRNVVNKLVVVEGELVDCD